MLFSLLTTAIAANSVITTYPCQRLGWAWRNVWVTCGIDARIPGNVVIPTAASPINTDSPNYNEGFNFQGSNPYIGSQGELGDLALSQTPTDLNAALAPAVSGGIFGHAGHAPHQFGYRATILNGAAGNDLARLTAFCQSVGAVPTGVTGVRTACRRSIDLYGSLLELCRNPVRARTPLAGSVNPSGGGGRLFAGTKNIWQYATPDATHTPHASNVNVLTFAAQMCVTPGQAPLGPQNSCPGLTGWWTVAYQACNVAGQFSTAGWVLTPQRQPAVTGKLNPGWTDFASLTEFCDNTATGTDKWMPSGPTFHRSACRRALDQFTRTAARCTGFANFVPAQKGLRNLGVEWGKNAPQDCA
jgi:hypothetical protein